MNNKCVFCLEQHNLNTSIKALGLKSSVIFETENWYVVPSIGGFVVGYLLIVNKKHMPSIAKCDSESYKDLEKIIKIIRDINCKYLQKKTILFEHGGMNFSQAGAKSVEHVHLHVVPVDINLLDFISTEVCHLDSLDKLKQVALMHNTPYLFFENVNGEKYYTTYNDTQYSSQFFRKAIAQSIGVANDWNWKQDDFKENFIETYRLFRQLLSNFNV